VGISQEEYDFAVRGGTTALLSSRHATFSVYFNAR